MFKVTAHIFRENGGGMVGRSTFVTSDHAIASHVASVGFEHLPVDVHANVDFEMQIPIGRRPVWVDADIRSLEHAAERLMQAALDIQQASRERDRKATVVAAE